MNAYERIVNVALPYILSLCLVPYVNEINGGNDAHSDRGRFPVHQVNDFGKAPILVNGIFGLEYAHKLSPLKHMVGPIVDPIKIQNTECIAGSSQTCQNTECIAGSSQTCVRHKHHMHSWLSGSKSALSIIINFGQISFLSTRHLNVIFSLAKNLQQSNIRILSLLTSDQYDSLRIITRRFPVNLRFKKLENLPVGDCLCQSFRKACCFTL